MQNSKALLENSLSISYKVKHSLWPKWYFFNLDTFKRFEILLKKHPVHQLLLLLFCRSVMFNSLWPNGLQHGRLPCPSPASRLLKLMCVELVMPFNSLILCCPLLLLPSIFPSIRVFSDELALCIRWPKYWHFSYSISPSNNCEDWFHLGWTIWIFLQSMGLTRVFSNTTVQKHQFFGVQPSLWSNFHIHTRLLEKP